MIPLFLDEPKLGKRDGRAVLPQIFKVVELARLRQENMHNDRAEIEQLTDYYLQKQGFDYHASLQLANDYFPTRVYGRLVFPCGYYDAARITLGKGKGHNWWCVLYPQFCFIDSACVATPEESLQRLKEAVGEEDWLALQNERPKLQIRFLLFSRHSSDTP